MKLNKKLVALFMALMLLLTALPALATTESGDNGGGEANRGGGGNQTNYYDLELTKKVEIKDKSLLELGQEAALSGASYTFVLKQGETPVEFGSQGNAINVSPASAKTGNPGEFTIKGNGITKVTIENLKADTVYSLVEILTGVPIPLAYAFGGVSADRFMSESLVFKQQDGRDWDNEKAVTLTNCFAPKTGSITVTKDFLFKDDDGPVLPSDSYYPTKVRFTIQQVVESGVAPAPISQTVGAGNRDGNWTAVFENVPFGEYQIIETIRYNDLAEGTTICSENPVTVSVTAGVEVESEPRISEELGITFGGKGSGQKTGDRYTFSKVKLALGTAEDKSTESAAVTFTNCFEVPNTPFITIHKGMFLTNPNDEGSSTMMTPANFGEDFAFEMYVKQGTKTVRTLRFPTDFTWDAVDQSWSAKASGLVAGETYTIEEDTTNLNISSRLQWQSVQCIGRVKTMLDGTEDQIEGIDGTVTITAQDRDSATAMVAFSNIYHYAGVHFEKFVTDIDGEQKFTFLFEGWDGSKWVPLDLDGEAGFEKTSVAGEYIITIPDDASSFITSLPMLIILDYSKLRIRELNASAARSGLSWDVDISAIAGDWVLDTSNSAYTGGSFTHWPVGNDVPYYSVISFTNDYDSSSDDYVRRRIPLAAPTTEEIPLAPPLTGESVAYGWALLLMALASGLSVLVYKKRRA